MTEDRTKELEEALREVQSLVIGVLCETEKGRAVEETKKAMATLGGIYNFCELVLRDGRRKK